MKIKRPLVFARSSLALLLSAFVSSTSSRAETPAGEATLSVDCTSTKPISPHLFGIFFEDINYAADGGLYAELVQNGSFEYDGTEQRDWTYLSFWTPVKRGGGTGNLSARSASPLHPNNPHYAAVEVLEPGEGFGLTNTGYDNIGVRAGETYKGSLFAKQLFMGKAWSPDNKIKDRPMPVRVQLETASGEVLAMAELKVEGLQWKQLTWSFSPTKDADDGRLVVLGCEKGGFALDQVSLFPGKTFRGHSNGLRADLAQTIADLHPKFMRFPGGCLVHGDGLTNIYHWKATVGPVQERKGQRNIWGYHQSAGLGYFEYFQFCEDIGAEPLPVVAAGVCCQNSGFSPGQGQEGLSGAAFDAYLQDVLDLIEWANGPADSKWGAVRAAAGHPKPFGLKFVGIGNEDMITPVFKERFKRLHDAVRAKHPEITVVGTVGPAPDGEDFTAGWAFGREEKVAVLDEHYYCPPEWFWKNLSRYDSYDRKGPQVYVGEYAAHEKNRHNTLRTALAEAAACTSFERNGDVVKFSSYAPLLSRVNHTRWRPDMIYFTPTEIVLSVNYQVQKLFGQNAGDQLLADTVAGVAGRERFSRSVVRDSKTGDIIVKLVNGDDTPLEVAVTLKGAASTTAKASLTLLGGLAAEAENELGKPAEVLPATKTVEGTDRFKLSLPKNSLTVLRIPAGR